MENFNATDLRRISWLGKPYMHKKNTVKSHSNKQEYLVTPGNPQRCNLMIAKRSIQLNFYVGLFALGVLTLINTISKNCKSKSARYITELEIF